MLTQSQLPPQLCMEARTALAQMRQIQRKMDACHQTGAGVQLLQRPDATHIINIEQQIALLHQLLAKGTKQQIVAGRDTKWHQCRPCRKQQFIVQLVGHPFGGWRQPRENTSFRPEQAFSEIRQAS